MPIEKCSNDYLNNNWVTFETNRADSETYRFAIFFIDACYVLLLSIETSALRADRGATTVTEWKHESFIIIKRGSFVPVRLRIVPRYRKLLRNTRYDKHVTHLARKIRLLVSTKSDPNLETGPTVLNLERPNRSERDQRRDLFASTGFGSRSSIPFFFFISV